ncbi:pheromone alpha factor receptor [Rhizina undulata]
MDSSSFDAFKQNFTIYYSDGSNVTVSLVDVDNYRSEALSFCVVFAVQIGAAGILLILLALLTKPDKRRAPLFFINIISLALVVIRSILQIMYFLGPWYKAFAYLAYYYDDIPMSAKVTSVAASTMQLLLQICIHSSLIMQVRVVYSNMPKVNLIMSCFTGCLSFLSIGFFFVALIQSSAAVIKETDYDSAFVYQTAVALFAVSICLFSLIFVVKLGMAIHRRKQLRLKRFGPLQIIFIMGCQTMILPAICSIFENTTEGISSYTAALVAIFLPLSSMWAAASTDSPSSKQAIGAHQMFPSPTSPTSSTSSTSNTPLHSGFPDSLTASTTCTSCTSSPRKGNWSREAISGVRVERSFDVMFEVPEKRPDADNIV